MQKTSKYVILSSLALIILLCMSSASAVDIMDNDVSSASDVDGLISYDLDDGAIGDDSVLCSDSSSNDDLIACEIESDENSLKEPRDKKSLGDSGGLKDNSYAVDSDNFNSYFADGVLKDGFDDSILVFNGEFADKGIIDIRSNNVTVIGNNSFLKNTVFCLESSNVMLTGLNFALDQEFADNDYAGILVLGDNCTVYNCTMNYTVPEDSTGFCVYAEGNGMQNLTLANNTFNFVGNNINSGWNFAIYIENADNSIVYGNNINCSLPLRSVDWLNTVLGAKMDAVAAFVAEKCDNLILSNNVVSTYASCGDGGYPTIDTVLVFDCNGVAIEGNRIYSEDFYTVSGNNNYLYGIDVHSSDDVMILDNQVDIRTTGGRLGMGTAYPIQVSPSSDVRIAFNNLTTFSCGPNIGIYSYGNDRIEIISNFINVTGLAGSDADALVAGIEVEDSNDLVWNNTIIVNNIGEYRDGNKVYGISFSQSVPGIHSYNIQYNNVTTNGFYAVSLAARESVVDNSIIANNVLVSSKRTGNRAVRVEGTNNTNRNNTDGVFRNTLNEDDLPDWLKNHKSLIPHVVVPKYYREGSHGSGLTPSNGNGSAPWNSNGSSGGTNNGNGRHGSGVSGNGSDPDSDTVLGSDRDTAPGVGGDADPSISAASPGDSGSSAAEPNAYEINDHDNLAVKSSNYISLGIICIIALALLLFGYKRQKDKEEEE